MATKLNTLTSRMVLIGLAIHAVLLPILFYGLLYIVEQSHEERFINDVRKYSRFLADVFELKGDVVDSVQVVRLLDSAALGSGGVYAELINGNSHFFSSSIPAEYGLLYKEDFYFGENGDDIYFLSIPFGSQSGRSAVLRMGFDEKPTIDQIKIARQHLVVVLLLYLAMSTVALILLSSWMTRPLKILQHASRKIAQGEYDKRLHVDSRLADINELSKDLESMRVELVGVNVSLKDEIVKKEMVDKTRKELERKLQQAQKLETIGVLAGGMAHEFNNILLPIFLYTEQAMHDLPADSPNREHLARVLKSAKRAKGLIQKILTFSRRTDNQIYGPVDIKLIIDDVLELLRALMPSTITLDKVMVEDSCMVLGDRDQIHQLIMNLCGNAYDAFGDGGGAITVTLDLFTVDEQSPLQVEHLSVGRYIRIIIHDTGHGIDQNYLPRIFEPFFTTRVIGKGTGLGLSVAHGIAISHNGNIDVESELGKGTTFYVYLPEIGTAA